MNEEMYNELFRDVVICGRYPLEKLDEMKWFIKSLEDKITILEKENTQLKSVIKEIREYIRKNTLVIDINTGNIMINKNKLLQILDKGDKE